MSAESLPPLSLGDDRPSRPRLWLRATRPLYLATSLVPGLAGALVAVGGHRDADWGLLPVMLLALALLHAATNACNDTEDAARGLDPPDKLNNSGVFSRGLLTTAQGRRLYGALFGATFLLGVLLSAFEGVPLLLIGLVGLLGGWLYTGGPWPYKYAGLGDPLIVLLMGPLLTQGAYAAITGDGFHAQSFWLGLGPGLLIAAVLSANNLSDLDGDRAAGLRTLAIRLGFARARVLYLAELAGGVVVPLVVFATGLFGPWILLPLVLAPIAFARARQVLGAPPGESEALVLLVPQTAQLHLLSCVLLCVAVVLDSV